MVSRKNAATVRFDLRFTTLFLDLLNFLSILSIRSRSKITFQKSIVLPYCHYGKFGSDFQCPAEVSRPRSVPSREGAATLGRLRGPGLGARWHFGGRRRHQALASDNPPRHRRTPSR